MDNSPQIMCISLPLSMPFHLKNTFVPKKIVVNFIRDFGVKPSFTLTEEQSIVERGDITG